MPERQVREAPGVEQRRGDHRVLARAAAGSRPAARRPGRATSACEREAPLGVPVVPEVRMIALPRSAAATRSDAVARAISSSSVGSSACRRPGRARRRSACAARRRPRGRRRTPRRRSAPWASRARATSVELRAGERGVEEQGVGAELRARDVRRRSKPRWLRHMIATPSPSLTPSSASAWASALVRSWTSLKVSVPSSSMIAGSSGIARGGGACSRRPAWAEAQQRVAGGHSRSGRSGRTMPALGERDERAELGRDGVATGRRVDIAAIFSRTTAAADPLGPRPSSMKRVDVAPRGAGSGRRGAGRPRASPPAARPPAAPPPPPWRARGRCRRSRAAGGRTPCGSRPTCPCRRAAGGSGGRRGGPGRGPRAGARARRPSRAARAGPRARRGAGRPGRRRAARRPRRPAAGGRRRSARAAATSASTPGGQRERAGAQAVDAAGVLVEGQRRELGVESLGRVGAARGGRREARRRAAAGPRGRAGGPARRARPARRRRPRPASTRARARRRGRRAAPAATGVRRAAAVVGGERDLDRLVVARARLASSARPCAAPRRAARAGPRWRTAGARAAASVELAPRGPSFVYGTGVPSERRRVAPTGASRASSSATPCAARPSARRGGLGAQQRRRDGGGGVRGRAGRGRAAGRVLRAGPGTRVRRASSYDEPPERRPRALSAAVRRASLFCVPSGPVRTVRPPPWKPPRPSARPASPSSMAG